MHEAAAAAYTYRRNVRRNRMQSVAAVTTHTPRHGTAQEFNEKNVFGSFIPTCAEHQATRRSLVPFILLHKFAPYHRIHADICHLVYLFVFASGIGYWKRLSAQSLRSLLMLSTFYAYISHRSGMSIKFSYFITVLTGRGVCVRRSTLVTQVT